MTRSQQPALALFSIGLLGLGILAIIYRDFALVWQPVPASLPARPAIAFASGVLMLLLGLGLIVPASRPWSVRILCPYLFIWAMLKVPGVLVAPKMEATWLGLGELLMLFAGGWTLFARLGELRESPLTGDRGVRLARLLFGLSVIPVGLSHIVYMKITAGFVPHWLPYREGWAVLTGVGQIASGLGLLFGVLPRIAGWAEAAQIMIYTLLVWLPAIVADPKSRLNWTAFFISWIIAAGATAVAQNVTERR